MSINAKIRDDAANFLLDEDEREVRLWVIYASSQTVGLGGAPLQQIPVDLVEDNPTALAQALVDASELYPRADGWIIEHVDSEAVPTEDLAMLATRLSETETWDSFIGLPIGTCLGCGGSGIQEACGDVAIAYNTHVCMTMQGDCERCMGSGRE